MKLFDPDPLSKFTLADLGLMTTARCETLDSLTAWGERLHPGMSCLILFRDIENRRAILRSRGGLMRPAGSQSRRYLLAGSLTEKVCDEGETITHDDVMSWSPGMPEISDFAAKGLVATPIDGPAHDKVGIVAFLGLDDDFQLQQVIADARNIASLVAQRVLLKATLATLQRVAFGTGFEAIPQRRKH